MRLYEIQRSITVEELQNGFYSKQLTEVAKILMHLRKRETLNFATRALVAVLQRRRTCFAVCYSDGRVCV